MNHIGYINNAQNIGNLDAVIRNMRQLQCSAIHIGEKDDMDRQEWKRFVAELNDGDVAVLLSFENAFRNYNDMIFFLKLCESKNIRFISLRDSLDSSDKLFPNHSTQSLLTALTRLSVTKKEEGFDDFEAELISDKHQEKKLRKYRMVINMYNAGYSIKEIMSRTGYRGKSNIYRILHMYNVELEYPTMVRTRLLQPNVIQRNL